MDCLQPDVTEGPISFLHISMKSCVSYLGVLSQRLQRSKMLNVEQVIFVILLNLTAGAYAVTITSAKYHQVVALTTDKQVVLPCHYNSSSGTNCTINWTKGTARGTPLMHVNQAGEARPADNYDGYFRLRENASLVLDYYPTVRDSSNYTCKVINTKDKIQEDESVVNLFVGELPNITRSSQKVVQFTNGDSFSLFCSGSGIPPPTTTWKKNGVALDNIDVDLHFNDSNSEDSGQYSCTLTNKFGNKSTDFQVKFCETLEMQNRWASILFYTDITIFVGVCAIRSFSSEVRTCSKLVNIVTLFVLGSILIGCILLRLSSNCRPSVSVVFFAGVAFGLLGLVAAVVWTLIVFIPMEVVWQLNKQAQDRTTIWYTPAPSVEAFEETTM